MSHIVTKEGNTKLPSSRARRWVITVNNYEESDIVTITHLFDKYIIGKEVGSENETKHLQVYGEREHAVRFDTLKKAIPKAHLEKAKGSKQANIDYCSKEGDFITNFKVTKPPKILAFEQLYDWQRGIEELIKTEPDDRTIYWYWDKVGCAGKTALVKRLVVKYGCVFSTSTSTLNILTQADPEKDVYLFNFSRSVHDFDPYGALEQLKDGLITDSKLKKESRTIVMDPPHVICFANKPPNTKKLSADRWVITRLDEESDSDEDSD